MNDVMQRLNTLLDQLKGKIPVAAKTADSIAVDGCPRPLTLDEARNRIEEQDRERSFQYGADCNEVGRQMRAGISPRDCRPSLRRTVDAADPHAWADKINEQGKRLRERK